MRKILLFIILILAAGMVFGQIHKDDFFFSPLSPAVMAQGNSFTAVATGYESLFTNPAGLARSEGNLTLLSLTGSPYFPVTGAEDVLSGLELLVGEDKDNVEAMTDALAPLVRVISDNGIGGNSSAGIGYTGNGIGLGFIVEGDLYGRGDTALDTQLDGNITAAAIVGLGYAVNFGKTELLIGGDLRFMHRVRTDKNGAALLDIMAAATSDTTGENNFDLLVGNGLGIDGGIIATRGSLSAGVSVRDIGSTEFVYQRIAVNDYTEGIREGEAVQDTYSIPMSINTGIAYRPDLGRLRLLLDPVFHAEYRHVFYNDDRYETGRTPSPWTRIHAGTEIGVLRFLKLRGGINQGYPTFGAGMKLLFLDLNMAYFTRETGIVAGAKPNNGFSLEAAIRF